MRRAIAEAGLTHERLYVGLLDLDRFKAINDSLGHIVGDQLLVEVANRLRRAARPQDTVARMGGDEFLLLLTGVKNKERAETIGRRILAELDRSFSPYGNELFVRANLGFSVYPDDATDPTQLLRLADSAMYEVKAQQSGVGFYEPPSDSRIIPKVALETALNRALERREFVPRYEPQVERSIRLRGAQALLHWEHPEFGLLTADRFMAAANDAGLSVPIGAWLFGEACRFAGRWKSRGAGGCVVVNVSPRQCRDADFVPLVVDAIAKAGIVPAQLWIEISETAIGGASEGLAATLAELRSYGIHTSIADFGKGSSNLQHLTGLPLDGIKIDGSLLEGMPANAQFAGDRAIFTSLARLSKVLRLDVAAKAIQTRSQLAFAFESGCDVAQGSVFSLPLSEEAFLDWSPPRNGEAHTQAAVGPAGNSAERAAIPRLQAELETSRRSLASARNGLAYHARSERETKCGEALFGRTLPY